MLKLVLILIISLQLVLGFEIDVLSEEKFGNTTIFQLEISFKGGDQGSPPHTHSGPALGYVIEGEFLFQVEGKPAQIIKPGNFFEDVNAVHIWGANALNDSDLRIFVTVFARPNEDLLQFVDGYQRESYEEILAKAHDTEPSAIDKIREETGTGKSPSELDLDLCREATRDLFIKYSTDQIEKLRGESKHNMIVLITIGVISLILLTIILALLAKIYHGNQKNKTAYTNVNH